MTGRSLRPSLAELVAGLFLLIVGTSFVLAARTLPPALYEPVGPAAFPAAAGAAIMLLSLIVLARALLRGAAAPQQEEEGPAGVRKRTGLALVTGVYTIAFIAVMQAGWLGFRWATVLFVLAVILTLARWRPLTVVLAVLMALGLGLGVTYLFTNFFYIDLPR